MPALSIPALARRAAITQAQASLYVHQWAASGITESITYAGGTLWQLSVLGEREFGVACREGFVLLGHDAPLVARERKRALEVTKLATYSASAALRGIGGGGGGARRAGRVSTGGE